MRYRATDPPADPQHLSEFLGRELQEVAAAMRDSDWIYVATASFANSFANVSGYGLLRFRRDRTNVVYLAGSVDSGVQTATDSGSVSTVFTLPQNYRPNATVVFPVAIGGGTGRAEVDTNGLLTVYGYDDGARVALDSVVFLAER